VHTEAGFTNLRAGVRQTDAGRPCTRIDQGALMSRRVAAVILAAVAAAGLAACDSGGGASSTPAAAPSSSVAPDPAGAVPTGTSVSIAGWDLAFAPTARDAAAAIKTSDPASQPPVAGNTFVMVTITAKNSGKDKASPTAGLTFTFAGSDSTPYGAGQVTPCGMIPNDLTKFTDVPPGETVSGTVCEVVPTGAINGGSWLAAAATGGMKLTFGLG
jgi:hypothetical protein